jgi:hypothetical protein
MSHLRTASADTAAVAAGPGAAWPGYAAFGWGLVFAGISFYWGCGGTLGLDTVGGDIESMAKAGDPKIYLAVWVTGVLKVVGAVLALALVRAWGRRLPRRPLLVLGWCAAVLLTLYGGFLVAADALADAGVITPSGPIDWTALRWHLWVWDMSFLVWGLLFAAALRRFRHSVGVRARAA